MTPSRAGELIITMLSTLHDNEAKQAIRTIHDDYEICKLWFIYNEIPFTPSDISDMVKLIHKTENKIKKDY